jgi:hypothetical protein
VLGIIISAMAAALLEAVVPAIWVAAKRGEFDFGRRQLIGWMDEGGDAGFVSLLFDFLSCKRDG